MFSMTMYITCTRPTSQLNAPSAGPFPLPPSTSTSLPPASAPVCRHSRVLRLCTDIASAERGVQTAHETVLSCCSPHHSPFACRPSKRIPMERAPNGLERM